MPLSPDPPICLWFSPLAAILTVDHSVVDLETIEALYENVGVAVCVTAAWPEEQPCACEPCFCDLSVEGATRGAGENQETLRDIGGRGS